MVSRPRLDWRDREILLGDICHETRINNGRRVLDTSHPLLSLISEIGFPIAATIGVASGGWFVVKWLMNTLERDISSVQDSLEKSQAEQMAVLVKLIDRIRVLENSVVRTEIVLRTTYNLQQEWDKIGSSENHR